MAASRPSSDATCDALFATLCALFLAAAATTVVLRPYRRWPDTALQSAKLLLMGLLNGVRVRPSSGGTTASGVTIAVALVLLLHAAYRLVSLLVEARLAESPGVARVAMDGEEFRCDGVEDAADVVLLVDTPTDASDTFDVQEDADVLSTVCLTPTDGSDGAFVTVFKEDLQLHLAALAARTATHLGSSDDSEPPSEPSEPLEPSEPC
jgi:hypothetical protein